MQAAAWRHELPPYVCLALPLEVLFEDFLNQSACEPLLPASVVEARSEIESLRSSQLAQIVAPDADAEPSSGGVRAPLRE